MAEDLDGIFAAHRDRVADKERKKNELQVALDAAADRAREALRSGVIPRLERAAAEIKKNGFDSAVSGPSPIGTKVEVTLSMSFRSKPSSVLSFASRDGSSIGTSVEIWENHAKKGDYGHDARFMTTRKTDAVDDIWVQTVINRFVEEALKWSD